MLLRERRRAITTSVYQARLIAAGLGLHEGMFDMWTMLYVDEVSHENYQPDVMRQKRSMLDAFTVRKRVEHSLVRRAEKYTVESALDLQPYSKEELEAIQAKLRKKTLREVTSK